MANTRVILTEDMAKLGNAGDVVGVKPGFARNYLIPQGKAIPATKARVNELEHHRRAIAERVAREMKDLQAVKAQLEGLTLEAEAQVGEEGKLFGSITAQQIADQLAEKGFAIDRRKVDLDEPIKSTGEHTVSVRLRGDVVADVAVKVEAAE